MKLLVLADDDSVRHELTAQPADLVLSLGDVADLVILEAAKQAQCGRVFAVKGNHDSGGTFPAPILDLHLVLQTVDGVRFGGFNGSWRYKPRGHYLYEQDEAEQLLAGFPPVDVFIAHNSPRNMHERDTEVHVGFEAFNRYIERAQPRLFIHGYQHVNQETLVGRTQVVGFFASGDCRFEDPVRRWRHPAFVRYGPLEATDLDVYAPCAPSTLLATSSGEARHPAITARLHFPWQHHRLTRVNRFSAGNPSLRL